MKRPLVLLIRDGWGIGTGGKGDAVALAKTPNMDKLLGRYSNCILGSSGEAVGLRPGAQGSSEVGHLNIGAGRVVEQEVVRVDKLIKNGRLFREPLLVQAAENCRSNDSRFHLMGLVQDQGVHAMEGHLYALLEFARRRGLKKVFVHFFADGRDTPPRSALTYLERLERKFGELGVGAVASVMGRYYAMDRAKNWERTQRAYEALILGKGWKASSAREAIKAAYLRADEKLNNGPDSEEPVETDEFIQPTLIADDSGKCIGLIESGDSVVHFNYRQDRAIQLTNVFTEPDFREFDRGRRPNINYVGLTRYYDEFQYGLLPPMNMSNILGEVISREGLWQLRISEYQKYRHVTSFFNSKLIKPFPKEDRVQVQSITIPENEKPEMSAYEVTEIVLCAIEKGIATMRRLAGDMEGVTVQADEHKSADGRRLEDTYDLIVLNYANCDMVGHTGDLSAAIKAVETVDKCVGRVVESVLRRDGVILVTADHGNAESMFDSHTRGPRTAHTTNDVEFVLVSPGNKQYELRPRGVLSDIAPTILELLGLKVPPEMTATSLLSPTC